MPPRASARSQSVRLTLSEPYVCPSCLIKPDKSRWLSRAKPRNLVTIQRATDHTRNFVTANVRSQGQLLISRRPQQSSFPVVTKRKTSNGTLASSSAINAVPSVPVELRDLHQQLLLLQDKASSYLDLSRLQLALRSLETRDPIVRVAFLGLGSHGANAARKLARVILSDVLGDKEHWEDELLNHNDDTSLLLKYGDWVEPSGVQAGVSRVRTMHIPSTLLRDHNLEILITPFNTHGVVSGDSERTEELEESILVPTLTMPNSTGGRVGFVRYPVHKALIVAEGINGAVEYGRLEPMRANGDLILAALSLPLRSVAGHTSSDQEVTENAIDIDLAVHALNRFRNSRADGGTYNSEWQTSRVSSVTDWLARSSKFSNTPDELKPAVEILVKSILSHSAEIISAADFTSRSSSHSLTVADATRANLRSALNTWSEEAHRDLQVNLATAFASPVWHRTAWWRLFWRIDEVSLSSSHIVRNGWLVEAEQNLAFLSGRFVEAGLATPEQLKGESTTESPKQTSRLLNDVMKDEVGDYKATQTRDAVPKKVETVAELLQLPPMLQRVQQQSGLNALFDPPWPQTINLVRQQMLHQQIPAMHRKAQGFLLATLSTIGGSGALAGWLWIATSGTALYEAGAIGALGLVWSLRRLQKKWGDERNEFAATAREDGRRVLDDIETRLGRWIADGGRIGVNLDDQRERSEARAAIEACAQALQKVGKK